jgi:hypothetical protein
MMLIGLREGIVIRAAFANDSDPGIAVRTEDV